MSKNNRPTSLSVQRDLFKYVSLAFMAVCMSVAAVLALTAPELPGTDNPTWMRIGMGVFGLPFSIGLLVFEIRRIFFDRYIFRIDEQGILDRSSAMAPGFVSWDAIQDVYLLTVQDNEFLCIDFNDREAWVGSLSKRRQRLAKANMDMGYAPMRVQFAAFTNVYGVRDALDVVKTLHPELLRRKRAISFKPGKA